MSVLPYPIFHFEPDFTREPRYGVASAQAPLKISNATEVVLFHQERADRIFAFDFALSGSAGFALAEFFRERGGITRPFFLPSWRRDLQHLASVSAGQTTIDVEYINYSVTHLTGTSLDHYGRFVFIWTPGQSVFVERVIQAVPTGTSYDTLSLDSPIPFTADKQLVLMGFAHVARFTEQSLDLTHIRPSLCSAEITFRSYREAITI